MDSVQDAPNTTLWDADSLSGEPCSRLTQPMVFHPRWLSKRPPTPLLDTDLSANKMVSYQSSSQKFFKMEITASMSAPMYPRESSLLLCQSSSTKDFCSRVSFLIQTWSPHVLHAHKDQLHRRSPGIPLELSQEPLFQLFQESLSSLVDNPRKMLPLTLMP